MINKIDHIGIAVKSFEHSLPFYTEILQLPLLGIEEVTSEKVRVAFIQAGNTKLELLEATNQDSPIARFIEKRGEGIHHIALGVTSIEDRIKEIKEKGIQMIHDVSKIGAGGAQVAFIHPKSTGGVLYEFCERKGRNAHAGYLRED
jgi:methylmalonyl-CoA/ethylmalonyl-CoA epimerase